jgi:hypothetical protein
MDRRGFLTAALGLTAATTCGGALISAMSEPAEAAMLPLGAARAEAGASLVEKAQVIVIRPRRRRRRVCWRDRFGRLVCVWR